MFSFFPLNLPLKVVHCQLLSRSAVDSITSIFALRHFHGRLPPPVGGFQQSACAAMGLVAGFLTINAACGKRQHREPERRHFFSTVLTHPIEGAFRATESVINLFETIFGLLDEACVGLDLRQRASDVQFVGRPRQNIVLLVATIRSDLEERVILRARAKPSDRSDANVRCPLRSPPVISTASEIDKIERPCVRPPARAPVQYLCRHSERKGRICPFVVETKVCSRFARRSAKLEPGGRRTMRLRKNSTDKPKPISRAPKVKAAKLTSKEFESQLAKLDAELVKLQLSIKPKGLKVVIVFEGRDAAGKGGVIKRITKRVSPRVFRIVALPAPTEREKTQMYVQRYIPHLPAAGEVVIFDRSWYNRAGVERVMGFCTERQVARFFKMCPQWERAVIESGVILVKYWFEVSKEEQTRRFLARINDGRKIWKLSPMDLESHRRWYDYSRARDEMLAATDTSFAPWFIVNADDKRRARLNCISHLLSLIPYKDVERSL